MVLEKTQQTFAYFFRNLTKTTCEARGMGGKGKAERGKRKAKLRQHEQRTSNVKRKGENGKGKEAIHLADISIQWNFFFMHRRKYSQLLVEQK